MISSFLLALYIYCQFAPSSYEYMCMMRGLPWFLTYTGNIYAEFTPENMLNSIGHFWSLAVEQQFYFLLAPLLLFVPGKYWKRLLIGFSVFSIALGGALGLTQTFFTPIYTSFLGFYFATLGGLAGLSRLADIRVGKVTLESLRPYADPLLIGIFALIVFCGLSQGHLAVINDATTTVFTPLFATALVLSISAFPQTGFVRFCNGPLKVNPF
ncbi:hypothetical protein MMA231_03368 [Asticcacaulis sp. MM231]